MEIMKLYNMRARVNERAKVSMKNESISSIYLANIKGKRPSLPKVIESDNNDNQQHFHKSQPLTSSKPKTAASSHFGMQSGSNTTTNK